MLEIGHAALVKLICPGLSLVQRNVCIDKGQIGIQKLVMRGPLNRRALNISMLRGRPRRPRQAWRGDRKGTNGVSTRGVTVNVICLTEGLFGHSRQPTFILPKVPGRTFFPNLSKCITFAAAPLVLTPFVRNQGEKTQSLHREAAEGGRAKKRVWSRRLNKSKMKRSLTNKNTTKISYYTYIYIYMFLFICIITNKVHLNTRTQTCLQQNAINKTANRESESGDL